MKRVSLAIVGLLIAGAVGAKPKVDPAGGTDEWQPVLRLVEKLKGEPTVTPRPARTDEAEQLADLVKARRDATVPQGVIRALADLMTDRDDSVRYWVAMALGFLGPQAVEAVPALQDALNRIGEHPAETTSLSGILFALERINATTPPSPASSDATAHGGVLPDSLKGWIVQSPDDVDWDATGYSQMDWYVSFAKGRLVVANQARDEPDVLPFKIKPRDKPGEVEMAGRRTVLPVDGGYLVGFDIGEFGGGVWWFSTRGTRRKKLTLRKSDALSDYYPENTHALAPLGQDVLAFEGLTHLGGNDGRVVRLSRGPDGDWRPSVFTELEACPHAVLAETASTWLTATTKGVYRIDGQAHVRPVWQPRGGHLYYPSSLARDAAGVVYMGMRTFVVRLTPREPDTYTVDVLAPPDWRRALRHRAN
jgi:hypothetical protein